MASQVAKNAPCPCGSGKKYKNCCLPGEGHTKVTASPERVKGNPASATQGGRFTLLLILAVIAVGVVIYSNTLHAPFAFDDTIISEQRASQADKISLKSIVSRQRPVSYLSFDLNYSLGGNDPFGYHVFNISIHLLTAIILYFFIHSTLNLPSLRDRYGSVSRQVAAIASLLFVSHPVQTQAVTYIVQRMTSLATMFYLLSLLAYAHGRMAVGGKRISLYIGSGLAALLAFGSKQHTVTLPIVIIVYEFFFFQGLDFKRFKKKLGLFFSLFIIPLIVGILYTQNLNWILQNYDQYKFSMGERLLTELRVIVYYISLLLLPLPSRLNVDYDFPLSYSLFSPPTTIISLFIIIALITAAVWLARRKPLFSFSLFWFLLTLVPESTILPLDIVFEHRLYLPSVGFFIIAALALTKCSACFSQEYKLKIELGVVALLILLLGWGTYQRNKVWGSAISLWSDVVKKSPNKARPHNMLGKAYAAAGKTDKALEEIKQAVKFDPLSYLAFDNLGRLYLGEGLPDEAIKASRTALRLNPDFMPAHNTLGMAYNRKKMYDEAIKSCLEAVKVRTSYPPSYFKPNYAESYLNLALAYESKGENDGAIEALQKVGKLLPHEAGIAYRLGNAYFNQGVYDKAKQAYQKALKLKPDLVSAYYNLGVMYFNRTQYEAAVEQYQKIIKIVPTHAPAYERLGLIYMDKLKNYKLALFNFKKALEFFQTDKAARLAKESIKRVEAKLEE